MKIINETSDKIQIEFLKDEYFAIKNWLVGKEAGETDLNDRDALENFISMENFLNPNQELKIETLTKEQFLNKIDHYYYIAKNYPERYFKEEERDFKNLFASDDEYKEVWRILSRTFSGMYEIDIADKFLMLLKHNSIEKSLEEITNVIMMRHSTKMSSMSQDELILIDKDLEKIFEASKKHYESSKSIRKFNS